MARVNIALFWNAKVFSQHSPVKAFNRMPCESDSVVVPGTVTFVSRNRGFVNKTSAGFA